MKKKTLVLKKRKLVRLNSSTLEAIRGGNTDEAESCFGYQCGTADTHCPTQMHDCRTQANSCGVYPGV